MQYWKKIKSRKASGLDDIPPEVWKIRTIDDIRLQLYKDLYKQNTTEKRKKGSIPPSPRKQLRNLYEQQRTTAKVYNVLFPNRIRPKVKEISRKNQNGFRRNRSTTFRILTIRRNIEGVRAKNLETILLFINFSKVFDIIYREKNE